MGILLFRVNYRYLDDMISIDLELSILQYLNTFFITCSIFVKHIFAIHIYCLQMSKQFSYSIQVREAAKRNFTAHGVEMNIWLVLYSKFKTYRQGLGPKATYSRTDLWKVYCCLFQLFLHDVQSRPNHRGDIAFLIMCMQLCYSISVLKFGAEIERKHQYMKLDSSIVANHSQYIYDPLPYACRCIRRVYSLLTNASKAWFEVDLLFDL